MNLASDEYDDVGVKSLISVSERQFAQSQKNECAYGNIEAMSLLALRKLTLL